MWMQKEKEKDEKIKEPEPETDDIVIYNYIIEFILRVQYILFNIYLKKFLLSF
jgi:hypothetical protein